jgi:2-polyprenyl-3-methyl-5-hydroxy-6-metoxy-1,4-benzoquinol methylase
MQRPLKFLRNAAAASTVLEKFRQRGCPYGSSYATVRDYCESVDILPQIAPTDGDLKNVQRPWAVKTIIGCTQPPARLLEIGGGEPIVSGFLAELGYDVTLADPYEGSGNGPIEYERYVALFPHVKIVREYFRPGLSQFAPHSFDCIFSVSVLEHIPAESLARCFDAIAEFLAPGGSSIHCFDFILQGKGALDKRPRAERILAEQARLTGKPAPVTLPSLMDRLGADVETFYLSPQGHHHWRSGRSYEEFPFRRVVSLQTIARRSA